jgi:excisionase family DNA binding protein
MTEAERHTARRGAVRVADAASQLEVSTKHVRTLIEDGELRALNVARRDAKRAEYRLQQSDIDDFKRRRSSRLA